ncbi:MAG TPA: MFS transporter [Sphingopyxis sp.]|nr:MFS transporter [Sphingopyxis sp.]HMP43702.1 MFS transporter [Sphingopyxis sp.]HMQ17664.1 MFS transporter [Sphingopyxis sp.]
MIQPSSGGDAVAAAAFDYSRRIREGGLGGRQALVLLMIGLLVLFDGMDNQLLGLIAHDMSRDLDIPISAFGLVFSAALVGAIAGALLMSAAADQWLGRKRVVIIGMVLAGLGTVVTAYAGTLAQLILVRFVTGIGLGAALPTLISLASEFSPQRHSRLVVSLMIAFVPLGSLLGSVMARAVMSQSDWPMLLHVAGITTLALTAGAALVVPESVHFLVSRKGDQRRAVAAVRQLFPAVIAKAVMVHEDPAERAKADRQPVARLFEAGLWKLTILFWIAFLMDQAILYFVMNWTPALLLRSGMSSTAGMDAAAMFGLGGALGTIAQGWLTTRFGIYKVMYVEILLFIAAMLMLPAVLGDPRMAPALVFVIAATICAYHAGLINLILEAFPEAIKSTAFGWAFGIGRIGAAAAPVLAGMMLGLGWSPALIFVGAAMLGVMTGLALLGVRLVLRQRVSVPA